MICQIGVNCHLTVTDSEAVQTGHGNALMKQKVSEDSGKSSERRAPRRTGLEGLGGATSGGLNAPGGRAASSCPQPSSQPS